MTNEIKGDILIWKRLTQMQVLEANVDWCSEALKCKGEKHTMCTYKDNKEKGECKEIKDNQTPDGRKKMLELHNAYRNKMAGGEIKGWPTAADMREMTWDCVNELVALSYKLGCGEIHTVKGKFKTVVIVCNFGPGGNTVGAKMYTKGKPASKCPSGFSPSKTYPNLCSESGAKNSFDCKDSSHSAASRETLIGHETILVLAICVLEANIDWCSDALKCKGEKNTMCAYYDYKNKGECVDIVDNQTPAGRKKMLDLHNAYRNKMAGGEIKGWPTAADMREMSWDCDIEYVALRWTKQCKPGHDSCRRTPKFEYVGQNYADAGSTAEFRTSDSSFTGWTDGELKLVSDPEGLVASFQGGKWGHLTQVVWADSYKLGCGEIHTVKGKFKYVVIVCNFGPGGNYAATKMYTKGKPASMCPSGFSPSKTYPNLCSESGGNSTFECNSYPSAAERKTSFDDENILVLVICILFVANK
ncbi:hypothetical protein GE061_013437 [Apolygus lucorum]|uniref:SCP domain-containing protein n=1 Tax=Apolygus lucorum TaxID=248454 RepID=A0A8S9XN07_APOLU|nr:hypothetical protein GE061_013437 [Apolygus lucorum]